MYAELRRPESTLKGNLSEGDGWPRLITADGQRQVGKGSSSQLRFLLMWLQFHESCTSCVLSRMMRVCNIKEKVMGDTEVQQWEQGIAMPLKCDYDK
jgi:hypothetical protein